MIKVKSESRDYEYQFHGGGYDGSVFQCGPGLPDLPPMAIIVEDDRFVWRYEFGLGVGDDEMTPGGYILVGERSKIDED